VHELAAHNLAENFHWSSFHGRGQRAALSGRRRAASLPWVATVTDRRYNCLVNEPDEIPPKRNYKWPWFVLAAVILFVVLTIVWVSFAVRKVEQQRNFNAPVPATAK